jgi:hypothetical protein
MDKVELAREMFCALEGNDDCVGEIARRAFCIQDRLKD